MDRKRILLVEDDEYIRDSISELLESEGYHIDGVGDGRAALENLNRADGALPGLILLDLAMPIMDGFEFRDEQLKNPRFAAIPVIVMSADGNVETKRNRIGAISFVRKPVDVDVLLDAVRGTSEGQK
jgi:CheY-like chemotaxis protein